MNELKDIYSSITLRQRNVIVLLFSVIISCICFIEANKIYSDFSSQIYHLCKVENVKPVVVWKC